MKLRRIFLFVALMSFTLGAKAFDFQSLEYLEMEIQDVDVESGKEAGTPGHGKDHHKKHEEMKKCHEKLAAHKKMKMKRVCDSIGLTEDQINSIKEIRGKFVTESVYERRAMQEAKNLYRSIIMDPHSVGDDADRAAKNLGTAFSNLAPMIFKMRHNILYAVLEHAQRKPFIRCVRMHKKMMKHKKKKKGHGHGHGHGHGGHK